MSDYVRYCSTKTLEEREVCAALMQSIKEGKIDAVLGANTESGVLRLLDAKLVEANEQLLRQLERSNVEIKQFTFAMTHDLQTPLVSLTGAVRVLRMHLGILNDEHTETWLGRIETAAGRMVAMLDDLMIYAKAGGEQVECSVLSLHEILQSVCEELRPLASQNGIQVHLEPTTATVLAEPKALHRVFANLVGNAIKYIERESGGEVKATVSEHQGIVRVRITDNGPGIASEHLSNVLLPFKRACGVKPGSGLGLSIVKRYVEAFGGRVWLESDGASGTTAIVELAAFEKVNSIQPESAAA